jgi:acetolactate synthase-1/2/3 large subunit
MWVFTEVDFAALAEQIGAIGIRVEKPADLAPAFDRALSADRPVILDVITDIDALAPVAVE